MDRYVFYAKDALDAKTVRLARSVALGLGVAIVASGPGTLLVEATPAAVRQLAKALPQWRYSVERHATRIPERRPVERVRRVAGAAAAAR